MKNLKSIIKRISIPLLASIMFISFNYSNLSDQTIKPTSLDRRMQERFYKNYMRDKVAVLVSTTSEKRDLKDLEYAYEFLSKRDYEIFTLTRDGQDYDELKVDDISNKHNLEILLNRYLANRIDDKDLFFFYVTGHGTEYKKDNIPAIGLQDTLFSQIFVDTYLSRINPQEGIVLFDICCAGNFVRNSDVDNYILMSSCSKGTAYDISFLPFFETFGRNFIKAFYGDERVTIDKAFDYASRKTFYFDSFTKRSSPLIKSEIDPKSVSLE